MQGFKLTADGIAWAADAAMDLMRFRVRVGGDIEQDFAAQWRDRIASAADGQPQGVVLIDADGDRAAHQLSELFSEACWHLQRVGVDHLATVVALNAGTSSRGG